MTPYNQRRLLRRVMDIISWRCYEMTGWSPGEWRRGESRPKLADVATRDTADMSESIMATYTGVNVDPGTIVRARALLSRWDEEFCRVMRRRLGRRVNRIWTLR